MRGADGNKTVAGWRAFFASRYSMLVAGLIALGSMATPSNAAATITDYSCANDNSNNGHYVPANHYWEEEFTSQGASITGGYVLLGANEDGGNHVARIGIYTGANRSGPLAETEVQVVGYGGVTFTFPAPVAVSVGQRLHLAVTGVGDFTAYDERPNGSEEGCVIGRLEGDAGPASAPGPQPSAPSAPAPSPSPQSPRNSAVAGFSRRDAVAWANEHIGDREFFSEDCTDFVSKDWTHGGGLRQQSWWYLDEWVPRKFDKPGITYSNTWAAAENFANEMFAHQWVRRSSITNMGAKIIPGAEPGDVVLWHDHNGSGTFWSHVALVMGVVHGATVIDQHTPRYVHRPWNQRWLNASPAEKHILHAQLLHIET